jgi:TDG/mug DNA glycosylase family protein
MDLKTGLPPLVSGNSKVLILGTLPGDESFRKQQYYSHPDNQFWRIIAAAFNQQLSTEYPDSVAFLHKRGIALWDVLRCANRQGSLDCDIENEAPNDVAAFLSEWPCVKAVFFNGGKACNCFKKHIAKTIPTKLLESITFTQLPSSSPTPGKYVKSFDAKLAEWKLVCSRI